MQDYEKYVRIIIILYTDSGSHKNDNYSKLAVIIILYSKSGYIKR